MRLRKSVGLTTSGATAWVAWGVWHRREGRPQAAVSHALPYAHGRLPRERRPNPRDFALCGAPRHSGQAPVSGTAQPVAVLSPQAAPAASAAQLRKSAGLAAPGATAGVAPFRRPEAYRPESAPEATAGVAPGAAPAARAPRPGRHGGLRLRRSGTAAAFRLPPRPACGRLLGKDICPWLFGPFVTSLVVS